MTQQEKWKMTSDHETVIEDCEEWKIVSVVYGYDGSSTINADGVRERAALITAAPELLEACRIALDWFNRNTKLGHTPEPVEQALIDAIDKAAAKK